MRMSLKSVALAFLVGALALISQGCGGPTLERWHTEELTEEFTAQRVDEIQTFDDYR